jgi:hypothetical protein
MDVREPIEGEGKVSLIMKVPVKLDMLRLHLSSETLSAPAYFYS